jgi:hypothetical protein
MLVYRIVIKRTLPVLPSNQEITFKGQDIVDVLREMNVILISLHRIGAYFGERDYTGADKQAYDSETNRFIDDWRVCGRLAKIRATLEERFDSTLGDDDMDDLERCLIDLPYWRSPASEPDVPAWLHPDRTSSSEI